MATLLLPIAPHQWISAPAASYGGATIQRAFGPRVAGKNPFQKYYYHQIFNISHILVGNKIFDHSDVVGASPVRAAPTTSST